MKRISMPLYFRVHPPQIIKQQTMEKSTEPQPSTQWFVFFKDQLLLKKGYTDKGEIKYSVPVSIEPPLTPEAGCLLYTSPSPRDTERSRMPSSA